MNFRRCSYLFLLFVTCISFFGCSWDDYRKIKLDEDELEVHREFEEKYKHDYTEKTMEEKSESDIMKDYKIEKFFLTVSNAPENDFNLYFFKTLNGDFVLVFDFLNDLNIHSKESITIELNYTSKSVYYQNKNLSFSISRIKKGILNTSYFIRSDEILLLKQSLLSYQNRISSLEFNVEYPLEDEDYKDKKLKILNLSELSEYLNKNM
ncbi:MAG: hypothetical protein PHV06_03160 [bacterium]|nr:hypothetical protein [bacterium]